MKNPKITPSSKAIITAMLVTISVFVTFYVTINIKVFAAKNLGTTTTLGNTAPVMTVTVSDGGSAGASPTNAGSNVTFTTTAKDFNGNQYYLAVCKTDAVTAGNNTVPTCASVPNTWAISTATNSESQASVTYTTLSGDTESNVWYAFVCDKIASTAVCYPITGSGDQGSALGYITFTGIPVDAATITLDSTVYEFDTANNGVTGGNVEVDTSTAQGLADVADTFVAVNNGGTIGSHVTARANYVYVYADNGGVGGNSIGMAEAGDTGSVITLSGANLSGGNDTNASPFNVNHAPTFGTVTVTDTSDGEINPGDTLRFKLPNAEIDDTDVNPTQDTINMYICTDATTSFNYSTNSCTGGSLICSDTAVNPTSEDASCDETGNTLVPPTDIHATENFKVYVEDSHDFAGTGTSAQSYTIQNSTPTHDTPELDIHSPVLPNSVASWQFEDGTGATSFDDETTNNNNSSCSGGGCPTWTQTGYSGGAYEFDGVDDYMSSTTLPQINFTNDFTVSVWAKMDAFTDPRSDCGADPTFLFYKFPAASGVSLTTNSDGGNKADFGVYFNEGGSAAVSSSTALNTGQWYNFTITNDSANKTLKFYTDSTLSNSYTYTGKTIFNPEGGVWTIGHPVSNCTYAFFDGMMDEPHIYSRALSATEITTLYSAYTTPTATSNMDISAKPINIADHDVDTTTVIYNWKKNGTSITALNMSFDSNITSTTTDAVLDYSGNANHGTLGGGTASFVPTWTSGGIKGGAYQFDGANDFIIANDAGSLDVQTGDFTIGAWVNTTNSKLYQVIGSKGTTSSTRYVFRINSGIALYGDVYNGSSFDQISCSYDFISNTGWHFVTYTRDYDGLKKLYIDGSECVSDNTTLGAINANSDNLYIGDDGTVEYDGYFNGKIDELRTYNIVLSAAQIAQNYNNGKPLFNTIVQQEISATDTSWVADTTINDAQSSYSNSTTKSTNTLDPGNAEPVQGTPSAHAHAPLDSGSVGYWQMEDGTGATAFDDETTNNNNGSCSGGACPTFTTESAIGGGYSFDGSTDGITLPVINVTDRLFTVSAWIYSNGNYNGGNSNNNANIIGSSGYDDGWRIIHSDFVDGDGKIYLQKGGPGPQQCSLGSLSAIPQNQWNHIVGVWNSTQLLIYINGTLSSSGACDQPYTSSLDPITNIGAERYGVGWFNGKIDEIQLYNRPLSATEIKNLYNSNSYVYGTMDLGASARSLSDPDSDVTYVTTDWRKNGTSAAVLNMSFNKNVTSTTAGAVTDYSSYGNNGQLGGGTTSYVPTWTNASTCGNNTGGCYSFDGSNDQIVIDTYTMGNGNWTVSTWVKTGTGGTILSNNDSGPVSNGMGVRTGKIHYENYYPTVGGSWYSHYGTTTVNDNQWHHLIWVNYDDQTMDMYVDGLLQDGGGFTSTTSSGAVNAIGRTWYETFNGLIDEVQIYNRALTTSQIANHYNTGKSNYQNLAYGELAIGDTWKANVTAFDANGNEDGTIVTNELEVLGLSAGPSDGSSSATTPTNAGSNVTFTATYNATSGRQWYLAVCKTNEVTAGNDTAPTCATSQTWAISSAANDSVEATATYTALAGDPESNVWYAFACDKVASVASCSPVSQGTGDIGSPFVVNHAGAFGAVFTSDSTVTPTQRAVDGDMEAADTSSWTDEIFSTKSKQTTDPHGGSRLLRITAIAGTGLKYPQANQSNTLEIGKTYRLTGWARSDGTQLPKIHVGGTVQPIWTGTNSTSWQYFDAVQTATTTTFALYFSITDPSGTEYVEFDDIVLAEVGTIDPGDTLRFTLPKELIADTDTQGSQDTMMMHICTEATTAFDYSANTCTGGTLICSSTAVDPTSADATCTGGASLITVPTAHGSYNFKVYVEDNNNLAATGTNTQSYSVADVAPTLVSYTATDTPDIAAGGSDTVDYSAVISDVNGDNDVTTVEGVLFDDTAVNNDCTADEKNCYIDTTCDLTNVSTPGSGKTATGTDTELTASCSSVLWFNSNASANWEAHVNPTDGLGKLTTLADTNVNLENPSLLGIDVVETQIAYGTLALGETSLRQKTEMQNMGNQILDMFIDGNTMCTDYPTCSGNTIAIGQQKWHHTDTDFNWSATPTNPGPYILVDIASGTDDETGCLNRDIAVRSAHDNTSTNESIWWKIQIPADQKAASYTGQNTFGGATGATCTAGQSY